MSTSRPGPVRIACTAATALLSAAALATSTSCSGEPAESPDPAGGIEGIRATVVQQRIDEGTRRIGVQLRTDADTSAHVRGVQLVSPAFEPVPTTDKDTEFSPGQTIDLTTTYGDARCAQDPGDALVARLTMQGADGLHDVEIPVTGSGVGLVRRLHGSQCASQALRRAGVVRGDVLAGRGRR